MDATIEWTRTETNAGFSFLLPSTLVPSGGQGIDSNIQRWQSKDLAVNYDYGRFSDSLTLYSRKKNYRASTLLLEGYTATLVSFERDDGWRFTGIHFPDLGRDRFDRTIKLTLVVEASAEINEGVSEKILRSICFHHVQGDS